MPGNGSNELFRSGDGKVLPQEMTLLGEHTMAGSKMSPGVKLTIITMNIIMII